MKKQKEKITKSKKFLFLTWRCLAIQNIERHDWRTEIWSPSNFSSTFPE